MKKMLLAACVLALCANAEASLIIGNSVTGPYQPGTNTGTKSVGYLTGSSPLLLQDIQVVLGGDQGGGGTSTFTLNSDAAGLPGGVIATIGSGTVVGFAAPSAYTITPASPLILAANTTYWIQTVFVDSTGLPQSVTADWDRTNPALAPSSGLATFIRYVFNGANSTTFNAIIVDGSNLNLPLVDPITGAFDFNMTVTAGQVFFVDPPVAIGYDFATGLGNPNFASVLLPSVGDNLFDLLTCSGSPLGTAHTGVAFSFGPGGLNCFRVRGIEPSAGIDPSNVTAFVTGLTFTADGTFTGTMTPITAIAAIVPQSASLLLMGAGLAGLIGRAWRVRRRH